MRRSRWPASLRPTVRAARRRVRRAAGCATHHSTRGALDLHCPRSRTMGGALSWVPTGPIRRPSRAGHAARPRAGTFHRSAGSPRQSSPDAAGHPSVAATQRRKLPRLAWTRCRRRALETSARRGPRLPATDWLGAAPAPRRGRAAGLAAPVGRPAVSDLGALRRRNRLARESRSPAGRGGPRRPGPRTGPLPAAGPRGEWRCCTKPPSTGPGKPMEVGEVPGRPVRAVRRRCAGSPTSCRPTHPPGRPARPRRSPRPAASSSRAAPTRRSRPAPPSRPRPDPTCGAASSTSRATDAGPSGRSDAPASPTDADRSRSSRAACAATSRGRRAASRPRRGETTPPHRWAACPTARIPRTPARRPSARPAAAGRPRPSASSPTRLAAQSTNGSRRPPTRAQRGSPPRGSIATSSSAPIGTSPVACSSRAFPSGPR